MDWENWDLRIVAVILVILSFSGGLFFGLTSLIIIAMVLVLIGFAILFLTPSGPPGTSGDLGLAIIVISACIVLILPAWMTYGVKFIMS